MSPQGYHKAMKRLVVRGQGGSFFFSSGGSDPFGGQGPFGRRRGGDDPIEGEYRDETDQGRDRIEKK